MRPLIDGFVCNGCGRTSYSADLAPVCPHCRTRWSGHVSFPFVGLCVAIGLLLALALALAALGAIAWGAQ